MTVLILIAAITVWALERSGVVTESTARWTPGPRPGQTAPIPAPLERKTARIYETYRNCVLAADKNNDGDSFRVRLPDGRAEIMRLYFVDTPESAFKSYRGGETNRERIADQAAYFKVSSERAVEIGQEAKRLTLDLLGKRPFTIHTRWDSPFKDQRYHAFVEVEVETGGTTRWLHELLIEKGLARIKTKPAEMPDGTAATRETERLRSLERAAVKGGIGGWGG